MANAFRFHISQYLSRRAGDWKAKGFAETLTDWASLNARSKFWGDDQRAAFKNWEEIADPRNPHGRRQGWLSNLHLGARDPSTGGFVMLGKTFKGLTDEMLRWQTERLLSLAVERNDWVVTVRPELVVEIAFDGVQTSPRYPGGVALRFARVLRYREDKRPEDADTIEAVLAFQPRP